MSSSFLEPWPLAVARKRSDRSVVLGKPVFCDLEVVAESDYGGPLGNSITVR